MQYTQDQKDSTISNRGLLEIRKCMSFDKQVLDALIRLRRAGSAIDSAAIRREAGRNEQGPLKRLTENGCIKIERHGSSATYHLIKYPDGGVVADDIRHPPSKFSDVSLGNLQSYIIRPGIEKKLIPLLLYYGRETPGSIQAKWNLAISMMLHNATVYTDGNKISNQWSFSQLCFPPRQLTALQLWSLFCRLRDNPKVTDNIPGLTEYVKYIRPTESSFRRVSLESYRRSISPWRIFRAPPRKPFEIKEYVPRPADLFYPYIVHEKKSEANDLVALVNGAVPKRLPEQVRADVCQDLIVAILSGELDRSELKNETSQYIGKVMKMFPTKWGPLSLDQPPPWSDDGRTLAEILS